VTVPQTSGSSQTVRAEGRCGRAGVSPSAGYVAPESAKATVGSLDNTLVLLGCSAQHSQLTDGDARKRCCCDALREAPGPLDPARF